MVKKTSLKNLTPLQKSITQSKSTEAPFSGEYNDFYEVGSYLCICCHTILFNSDNKYNSSSGWPSFTKPLNTKNILFNEDIRLGMKRVEVCCSQCESHLGHVFDDGPAPEFKRYCINSASLLFKPLL